MKYCTLNVAADMISSLKHEKELKKKNLWIGKYSGIDQGRQQKLFHTGTFDRILQLLSLNSLEISQVVGRGIRKELYINVYMVL